MTTKADYLKKYLGGGDDGKKKKKKKRPKTAFPGGITIVDEDPQWGGATKGAEEEVLEEPVVEAAPHKVSKTEAALMKVRQAGNLGLQADGSGWITAEGSSPVQKRQDSDEEDLSPPRRRGRHDSEEEEDLSPPRRGRDSGRNEDSDLSPPRRTRRHDSDSEGDDGDLSPPRRRAREDSEEDLSPPRRKRPNDTAADDADLSPPRKRGRLPDDRAGRPAARAAVVVKGHDEPNPRSGLIKAEEMADEIKAKKDRERKKFEAMNAEESGRAAQTVIRDASGKRIADVDGQLANRSQRKEEEEAEVERQMEWGGGVKQAKDKAKALEDMRRERAKPFARSRNDPELDSMMRDRVRFGDPMAHLVKRKEAVIQEDEEDEDEQYNLLGFKVPKAVPAHSWLKRGIGAALNRYNIRPGRHWDGVDRSNGFEEQLFKTQSEKAAFNDEAYKWSTADM